MDNTIDALKNLYVALGGAAEDVADLVIIPDMINALAGIVSGGSGLPEVTASDNGKVLKVVNGEWSAANESAVVS